MGIEASYRRLSPDDFRALQVNPQAADAYFGHAREDGDEGYENYIDAYFDRLHASDRYLDIDKDWAGLHFLLTGDDGMGKAEVPPPLGNVVVGGMDTEWDATYGMVRYLTPKEVKDAAVALEQITEDELRSRYDLAAFRAADIYPGGEVWSEHDIEPLLEVFAQVRDFFAEAARQGEVVLLSSD
jgi:hypothetical protein